MLLVLLLLYNSKLKCIHMSHEKNEIKIVLLQQNDIMAHRHSF